MLDCQHRDLRILRRSVEIYGCLNVGQEQWVWALCCRGELRHKECADEEAMVRQFDYSGFTILVDTDDAQAMVMKLRVIHGVEAEGAVIMLLDLRLPVSPAGAGVCLDDDIQAHAGHRAGQRCNEQRSISRIILSMLSIHDP